MVKSLISIILISFLSFSIGNAQSIKTLEKIGNGRYTNGEMEGKLHHFNTLFSQDPLKQKDFLKFNRTRKSQKAINYLSIGMGAASFVVAGIQASKPNDSSVPAGFYSALIGLSASTTFFIIGNIVTGTRKAKYKSRLLSDYSSMGINQNKIQLEIGRSEHGIGLKINF